MFFGPRLSTVFASRWKALMWSAGILMTAYCSIPSADEAPDPSLEAIAQLAGQQLPQPPAHHKSPWDRADYQAPKP